jgi:hypothetical protein
MRQMNSDAYRRSPALFGGKVTRSVAARRRACGRCFRQPVEGERAMKL